MRYVLLLLAGLVSGFSTSSADAAQIVGIGGKCLNVKGGGDADGTPIILWPCSGTENEQWHYRHGRIVGIGGKCLNVAGGGDANGTPIILYHCSGTDNERWHREGRRLSVLAGNVSMFAAAVMPTARRLSSGRALMRLMIVGVSGISRPAKFAIRVGNPEASASGFFYALFRGRFAR
jgi:hypothetical protein